LSKIKLAGLAVILFLGLFLSPFLEMTAAAQSLSIQLKDGAFFVAGWKASAPPSAGWSSIFSVYAGTGNLPAILGTYSVENGSLVFRPQFPLAPGVRYRAVFHPSGSAPVEATFDGPRQPTVATTRVERVYPSADVLPSNDLKLYIYFSAPMSRGEAWQHIHLLDANGKPIEHVFLELGQELWDPDYRRLTVLFDPGRIKRGVAARDQAGPPIEEGKSYTFVVDGDWKDARGVPLVAGFRKSFRGGPEDRIPPDPQQWRITAPKAATAGDLVVIFPKPMDYALLERVFTVSGASGAVAGKTSVGGGETEWRFTPGAYWRAGDYQLIVSTDIEDLCGNKIGHPFDLDNIDAFERVTKNMDVKTISLPFTVR